MPDDSRTLLATPASDSRVIRDTQPCLPTYSVTALLGVEGQYVPLSKRSINELLARADELRRMAETATTIDVARALVTLADRYAALAAKRRTDEGHVARATVANRKLAALS